MILLAANNSRVKRFRRLGYSLGWMLSPSAGYKAVPAGLPYAIDNGLYHPQHEPAKGMKALPPFYRLVRRCLAAGHAPMFVVVPDVPYDMARSRILSKKHRRHLLEWFPDLPLAIALQDGATDDDLDGYDWCFVGGSTDWKWRTCEHWCAAANERGMRCHIARVNTANRINHCIDIGADSADGTGIWRGDRKQLAGVLAALTQVGLWNQRAASVV